MIFELHTYYNIQPNMRKRPCNLQYVPKGFYDETTVDVYEYIERIENGELSDDPIFRVRIDDICYAQYYVGGNRTMLVAHAFRTDKDVTSVLGVGIWHRMHVFTSAFRSCMLNMDHAIELIKLRVLNIRSYIAINKMHDTLEYYDMTLPRFQYNRHHSSKNTIKYVLAARMYVSGMTFDEIDDLLMYKFNRNMKLITE